jgi:dihydroorotate dehydrogenase (NAD+) catalytic subunit
MEIEIKIGKKRLPNPIGVASGTFGYGSEYEALLDFKTIGALYTKALTPKPRPGNDVPRMVETPSGLLNSIGLANIGVDAFLKDKLSFYENLPCAIIANVAGASPDEYVTVIEKLEESNLIWGYEINVSCPNVSHGGMAFGTDPAITEKLTKTLRKKTAKPLIIKLTPNVTDITVIAGAAEAGGADALSCINSVVGMAIDVKTMRPMLPARTGGLSGPAIRPIGVAMTYKVSRAVKIPVIGMGGIMNAADALQYFLAGASAIQIGTANFIDPQVCGKVLDGVVEFCKLNNVKRVIDIRNLLQE